MRGGYRVGVVNVTLFMNTGKKVFPVRSWFEAASPQGKNHTVCGHKHKTESKASACIPAVELAYREKRWPGSTARHK